MFPRGSSTMDKVNRSRKALGGFGYYFVRSVFLGDYLLINGFLVIACIIIISGTLVADVLYTIIDPRIVYT